MLLEVDENKLSDDENYNESDDENDDSYMIQVTLNKVIQIINKLNEQAIG